MIKGTLKFASDVYNIIVDRNNIMYESNGVISTIEGLKLNRSGVIKEFPDLEDDDDWRKKAIERLKEHIKKMKTEREVIDYIKGELVKFGNEPMFIQVAGFRPKKW